MFSKEEIRSIKEEFDYRERLKDQSANEDEVSIFTVHNLDTTESAENGADLSKSTILAPFNSNEPREQEFIESVKPLVVAKRTLKFSSKLREIDRQYERNNNSKLDNGVYVAAAPVPNGESFLSGSHSDKGHGIGLTGRSSTGSTTLQSFSSATPAIGTIIGRVKSRSRVTSTDGEDGL